MKTKNGKRITIFVVRDFGTHVGEVCETRVERGAGIFSRVEQDQPAPVKRGEVRAEKPAGFIPALTEAA